MRRLVFLALVVAGCAAAPLPTARPLQDQTAQDLAWDARTCAWRAEDASGYDPTLAPDENRILSVFTRGPAPAHADPALAQAEPVPRAALGRGGRSTFDQVYADCMTRRGYELSSPAEREKTR
jgi:hypothetical protein